MHQTLYRSCEWVLLRRNLVFETFFYTNGSQIVRGKRKWGKECVKLLKEAQTMHCKFKRCMSFTMWRLHDVMTSQWHAILVMWHDTHILWHDTDMINLCVWCEGDTCSQMGFRQAVKANDTVEFFKIEETSRQTHIHIIEETSRHMTHTYHVYHESDNLTY